ncbi:allantoate amidohydrolase, partial [Rhizobium sp. Pop5]
KVVLLIDGRAEIRADMDAFCRWLDGHVEKLAAACDVTIKPQNRVSDNLPTPGDAGLLSTLEAACDRVGAKHRRMASGAGHDTAWIAKVAPAAMIFVPCREGRSHSADEWADNDDIALGAAVLFEAVREMEQKLEAGGRRWDAYWLRRTWKPRSRVAPSMPPAAAAGRIMDGCLVMRQSISAGRSWSRSTNWRTRNGSQRQPQSARPPRPRPGKCRASTM